MTGEVDGQRAVVENSAKTGCRCDPNAKYPLFFDGERAGSRMPPDAMRAGDPSDAEVYRWRGDGWVPVVPEVNVELVDAPLA